MPKELKKIVPKKIDKDDQHETQTVIRNGFVTVEKSITKNLGDYNSAKVTVGVQLPLHPTKEEIDKAKKTLVVAHDIVDNEMATQVKDLPTKDEL